MVPAACHTPNAAPAGSVATVIRPLPGTSNGSASRVPPLAVTLAAVASVSSLARYTVHAVGWLGSCFGPIAAAACPLTWQML